MASKKSKIKNKSSQNLEPKTQKSTPLPKVAATIRTETKETPKIKSMIELTHRNHFQFGYDGKAFIDRTSNEQRWWVNYGRCSRWPLDWRSECIIAAREIRASTNREIWLCFSGGIDSEIVAESFRYARIPIRAAILRFKNDINAHDISWAISYCEMHKVPYELFDLDINAFFDSGEMMHFADLTSCPTPQLPSSMKLMELIAKRGGYPILGSAECYLSRHNTGWYMYEREKIASLYRYLLKTNTPGQAGFYQWNPEIMYSFLVDPLLKNLVEDKIPNHKDTYYLKPELYAQYWKFHTRPKYTGFEKIERLDRKWRPILEQKFGHCDEQVYIRYDDLVQRLTYVKPIATPQISTIHLA